MDLDARPDGAAPYTWVDIDTCAVTVIDDGPHGRELWRTDGTAEGTQLVKDIRLGSADGVYDLQPIAFNGRAYFRAQTDATNTALWVTDGTAEGTFALPWDVESFSPGDSTLFFMYNGTFGSTDGTIEGTYRYPLGGHREIAALGDALLVSESYELGHRLKRFDAQLGNRTDVILFPLEESPIYRLSSLPDAVLFFHGPGGGAYDLWRTDGTQEGTVAVTSGAPFSGLPSRLRQFTTGNIYYFYTDGTRTLWRSDGTAEGTFSLGETGRFSSPVALGDHMYFVGGGGIWRTGGTPENTALFCPLTQSPSFMGASNLTAFNGRLYFAYNGIGEERFYFGNDLPEPLYMGIKSYNLHRAAGRLFYVKQNDPTYGNEFWLNSGTPESERILKNIIQKTNSQNPRWFPVARPSDPRLLKASTGDSFGLYRSDGTVEGTRSLYPARLFVEEAVRVLPEYGRRWYFRAAQEGWGYELWQTDGTALGTRQVIDLMPGAESGCERVLGAASTAAIFLGNETVANDGKATLWSWQPGTGTQQLATGRFDIPASASLAVAVKDTLFFCATSNGEETLWCTDGTTAGTTPVVTAEVTSLSFAGAFACYTVGTQLWATEGGAPVLLQSFSSIASLHPANGRLFFLAEAEGAGTGAEPWTTDGTPEGTYLVADVAEGQLSSDAAGFTAAGDTVFFVTRYPHGLCATSGLAGDWRLVKDFAHLPLFYPPGLGALHSAGDHILLEVNAPDSGRELWESDGTSDGTVLVADISSGEASTIFHDFVSSGPYVGFVAEHPTCGKEPFMAIVHPDKDDDADGLTRRDELRYATDPFVADTDGDGVDDGVEVGARMDPNSTDSDGDGLSDGDEFNGWSSPVRADSDGDGLPDGQERPGDTDGDGVPDIVDWDSDNDGISDGIELAFGRNPWVFEPATDIPLSPWGAASVLALCLWMSRRNARVGSLRATVSPGMPKRTTRLGPK